jgi:DNA replication licensing factor MCM4
MEIDEETPEIGLKEEDGIANYTEQQIKKFKEFSQDPSLYDMLIDSFAPSIWENQDVKKGILCQLFGGVSKEFS